MVDARTEEEVAFGVIPCKFGGEVRLMPTLKRRAAKEWKAVLAQKIGGTLAEFNVGGQGDAQSIEDLTSLGMIADDVIFDLVVAYDRTGALGGAEWLDEHADDREVYRVLRQILDVHFPFVKDVLGAMGAIRGLMANPDAEGETPDAKSPPVNSPSSLSPSGASPRTKSTTG